MTDKQNYFTYIDNTSDDNDKIMENLHKQIIDGIDVSACKWFTHNQLCECAIKPADDFHCHANPNCHYKQYQRELMLKKEIEEKLLYKQQQCNRLKEEVSLLKESNSKLQQIEDANSLEKYYLQQIAQLKTKNEELKKSKKATEEASELFVKNADEIARVLENKLDQMKSQLLDQEAETLKAGGIIHKLEQALVDIKAITEHGKHFAETYMVTGEQKRNVLTYADAILQKIAEYEVLND